MIKTGLGLTAIGSGSRGNSFLLHSDDGGILIDAGFSRAEIMKRLSGLGIDAGIIRALLLTHDHGDHVRGARVLADKLAIPTYATRLVAAHLRRLGKLGRDVIAFEPGDNFEVAGFGIQSFAVPHDALDPVGFVIAKNGLRAGFATDLGHLTHLVRARLTGCDILVLECNHDVELQRRSERHVHLKRRVLGRHGHLSNDDAMFALGEILGARTRRLFLVHLSGECNSPQLVKDLAAQRLADLGRSDILVHTILQEMAEETVWLDSEPIIVSAQGQV